MALGFISCTMAPKAGTRYLQASAGKYASYFVRDDGVVVRVTSTIRGGGEDVGEVFEIQPPEGVKYIEVTSGNYCSFLLRDDGAVDRTTGRGHIKCTIPPPWNTKYITVSSGTYASYFLRHDGKVDRTEGELKA